MKRLLVALIVLALSLPGLASALVYSPSASELGSWGALANSSTRNTFSTDADANAVKYAGKVYGQSLEPSTGYVWIGKNFSTPLDLSSFSTYALHIYNVNESIWKYSLYAQDSMGWTAVSTPFPTPIVNERDAVLQIDLAAAAAGPYGLDLSDITSLGLIITQQVPIPVPGSPMGDRFYETIVAPVPEPGTMMLLGAGFLGLAIYGKRRRNV